MYKITAKIEDMMCGMCEAHINAEIRRSFRVRSVKSSYKKGEMVIVTRKEIPESELRDAIENTGYVLVSMTTEPYVRKKLFSFLKKT